MAGCYPTPERICNLVKLWMTDHPSVEGSLYEGTYAQDIYAILLAARRAAPEPSGNTEVEVKPLEWSRPTQHNSTISRALSVVGIYRVWTHHEANGQWFWSLVPGDGPASQAKGEADTEEAAKAAAAADYEHRILSALVPASSLQAAQRQIERLTKELAASEIARLEDASREWDRASEPVSAVERTLEALPQKAVFTAAEVRVSGLPRKAIYNALGYLCRRGNIVRIGYGTFQRPPDAFEPDHPSSEKGRKA